jgi:hypothetical protein
MKGSSILTDKWYRQFSKKSSRPAKVIDIKNTIINQPSLTLQFNNTIMNHPVTYRAKNKYKHLNDSLKDSKLDFHKIFKTQVTLFDQI